jgi:hypothetical protein
MENFSQNKTSIKDLRKAFSETENKISKFEYSLKL